MPNGLSGVVCLRKVPWAGVGWGIRWVNLALLAHDFFSIEMHAWERGDDLLGMVDFAMGCSWEMQSLTYISREAEGRRGNFSAASSKEV